MFWSKLFRNRNFYLKIWFCFQFSLNKIFKIVYFSSTVKMQKIESKLNRSIVRCKTSEKATSMLRRLSIEFDFKNIRQSNKKISKRWLERTHSGICLKKHHSKINPVSVYGSMTKMEWQNKNYGRHSYSLNNCSFWPFAGISMAKTTNSKSKTELKPYLDQLSFLCNRTQI